MVPRGFGGYIQSYIGLPFEKTTGFDAVLFFACFLPWSSFSLISAHNPDASNYLAWRRSRLNGCTMQVFPSIAEILFVVASMKIKKLSVVSEVTVQAIALPMILVICCSMCLYGSHWGNPGVALHLFRHGILTNSMLREFTCDQ